MMEWWKTLLRVASCGLTPYDLRFTIRKNVLKCCCSGPRIAHRAKRMAQGRRRKEKGQRLEV